MLVAHTGSIPTLAILIPAPLNLQLNATPILTGSAVQALVVGIPDIPLSSLTLSLPGGPNSLFRAGVHLCSSPQTVSGNFTAWSGATANPSAHSRREWMPRRVHDELREDRRGDDAGSGRHHAGHPDCPRPVRPGTRGRCDPQLRQPGRTAPRR